MTTTEQSERAVLASVLEADGLDDCPRIEDLLRHAPESFDDLRHGQIAVAIFDLRAEGRSANIISVASALRARSQEAAGTVVPGLMADALPTELAEMEAGSVWEAYRRRRIAAALQEAGTALESHPAKANLLVAGIIQTLGDLFDTSGGRLVARSIGDLHAPRADDPDELIKDRLLCRGGGWLLAAPTGIGKSVIAVQFACCFAVSRECLGLRPARALRLLIIQAENDDGDLAEIRDGILKGLGFTEQERAQVFANVHFLTVDDQTGPAFVRNVVGAKCKQFKPDIVIIDPVLAYAGGDISRQEVVSPLLRNHLNPVLHANKTACLLIHHTNKPASGREKPDWKAGDLAYLGSGSAELANWARAVMAIRNIGSHEVFELVLAKRGRRAGWRNADGSPAYSQYIAHGKDGIYWRIAEAGEVKPKGGREKGHDTEELVGLLAEEELRPGDWQKKAKSECGISESTFHRERRALVKAGRILKSRASGKYQAVLKT